jgi:hypothetical protein
MDRQSQKILEKYWGFSDLKEKQIVLALNQKMKIELLPRHPSSLHHPQKQMIV